MSTKRPSPCFPGPESFFIGSLLIFAAFWGWKLLKRVKLEEIEMNVEFTPRLKLSYQKDFLKIESNPIL